MLGLGLNYCITGNTIDTTKRTFDRFRGDARRMYHLAIKPPEEKEYAYGPSYIPKLHIKSDYEFPNALKEIEDAIDGFESDFKAAQFKQIVRRISKPNLNYAQRQLLRLLRRHDDYIVTEADKNLGPAILDRTVYIRQGIMEHLGNERNYKVLTEQLVETRMRGLKYAFGSWMMRYYWEQYHARRANRIHDGPVGISDGEANFLSAALHKYPNKLARFRMTVKAHKIKDNWKDFTPPRLKMRPIVCCAGTFMNCWSRWLDYQLQRCKPFIPTYLRDSNQVIDDIKDLNIPPNARLFTADANSMYNNIDTDHACTVIGAWLDELAPHIGKDFPIDAIKVAMHHIMRNNIFEWGTLYFLQLLGTAMGTSAAVMWATLYFGYHETKSLIPTFGNYFLYFKRFIDDIFGIWLLDDTTAWDDFKNEVNNFGILTWEFEQELVTSVDFLDLTITIKGGQLETRTYQKPMNLYLYLPPSSAHSPGVIKSTIFGLMSRYHAHNTHRKDYLHFVSLLFDRLLMRGWKQEDILPIFLDSALKIESRPTTQRAPKKDKSMDGMALMHLQYHPNDVTRQQIRRFYEDRCSELFQQHMGIERLVIAYSRLHNIGEYITQAKLHEAEGLTSESILGEIKDGLAPP